MRVVIYNREYESFYSEGNDMLRFQRLKLVMVKANAKMAPDRDALERLMNIYGTQTIKDSEGTVETRRDGSFIFWYSAHGYGLPLAPELLVKESDGSVSLKPNSRQPNEIEPRTQVFGVYDTEKEYFYLSDSRKQSYFTELFDQACKDIGVKWEFLQVYKNPKEFLATIKSVKTVTLVSDKNLFNAKDYDFPAVKDLGPANAFRLTVDFSASSVTDKVVLALESLTNLVKEGRYKELICVGYAGDSFERVFNTETFVERVLVSVKKDENTGMYSPDDVMRTFINQLVGMDHAAE